MSENGILEILFTVVSKLYKFVLLHTIQWTSLYEESNKRELENRTNKRCTSHSG
jgi:hypothetical protein